MSHPTSPHQTTPTPNPAQTQTQTQKPKASLPTTPSPWTHEETVNLIQTYQQKWYSLNRGQLKASQWDHVAHTIAVNCGLLQPSKSGTQCRHKMEKLRKRFRAEKLKLADPATSVGGSSGGGGGGSYHPWIYFPLMDHLDRGVPIPQPPQQRIPSAAVGGGEKDGGGIGGGGAGRRSRGVIGELAGEMRGFVERFVMIERKKMEVMRENERFRLEMENKKLEMILVAHQKTADIVSKVFDSSLNNNTAKKVKLVHQDL